MAGLGEIHHPAARAVDQLASPQASTGLIYRFPWVHLHRGPRDGVLRLPALVRRKRMSVELGLFAVAVVLHLTPASLI